MYPKLCTHAQVTPGTTVRVHQLVEVTQASALCGGRTVLSLISQSFSLSAVVSCLVAEFIVFTQSAEQVPLSNILVVAASPMGYGGVYTCCNGSLLLCEDYVWVSLGNAMKAKQSILALTLQGAQGPLGHVHEHR